MVGSISFCGLGNKRAWIRILEATIAVMIVSGVLVVVYSQQGDNGEGAGDYIYSLQKQVLMDISSRSDLRSYVLREDISNLESYIDEKIPTAFNYSLKVCDFTDPPTPCKLDSDIFIATQGLDVYVEETIVSADFEEGYSPKKVKLFVWENK